MILTERERLTLEGYGLPRDVLEQMEYDVVDPAEPFTEFDGIDDLKDLMDLFEDAAMKFATVYGPAPRPVVKVLPTGVVPGAASMSTTTWYSEPSTVSLKS